MYEEYGGTMKKPKKFWPPILLPSTEIHFSKHEQKAENWQKYRQNLASPN